MNIVSPLTITKQLGKHVLNAAWDDVKNYNTNLNTLVNDAQEIKDNVIKTGKTGTEVFNNFKTGGLKKFTDWFFEKENDFGEWDLDNGDDDFDAGFQIDNGLDDGDEEDTSSEVLDARSMKDITRGQVGAMYQIGGKQVEAAAMNASEIISAVNNRTSEIIASINNVNNSLGNIQKKLDQLIVLSPGYTEEKKRNTHDEGLIGYDGQLTLGSTIKAFTKELSSYTDLLGMGKDMLSMSTPAMLIQLAASPLKSHKFKKFGDRSIDDIGESFDRFIGNAINEALTSILDVDFVKDHFDLNKGPGQRDYSKLVKNQYTTDVAKFDGITRQTIVDIIPAYLQKITESISGEHYEINERGHITTRPVDTFSSVTSSMIGSSLNQKTIDRIASNMHDDRITKAQQRMAQQALTTQASMVLYKSGRQTFTSNMLMDLGTQTEIIERAVSMLKMADASVDWQYICETTMTFICDDINSRNEFIKDTASRAKRTDQRAMNNTLTTSHQQDPRRITDEMVVDQFIKQYKARTSDDDELDDIHEKIRQLKEERKSASLKRQKQIAEELHNLKKTDNELTEKIKLREIDNGTDAYRDNLTPEQRKEKSIIGKLTNSFDMSGLTSITQDIFDILNRGINVHVLSGKPFRRYVKSNAVAAYDMETPDAGEVIVAEKPFTQSKLNKQISSKVKNTMSNTIPSMPGIDVGDTTVSPTMDLGLQPLSKSVATMSSVGTGLNTVSTNEQLHELGIVDLNSSAQKPQISTQQEQTTSSAAPDKTTKQDQHRFQFIQTMIQAALHDGDGSEDVPEIRNLINQISDQGIRNMLSKNVKSLLDRNSTDKDNSDPNTPPEKKRGILGGLFSGLFSGASKFFAPLTALLRPITSLVKTIAKPLINLAKKGFKSGKDDIKAGARQVWDSLRGKTGGDSDEEDGDGDSDDGDGDKNAATDVEKKTSEKTHETTESEKKQSEQKLQEKGYTSTTTTTSNTQVTPTTNQQVPGAGTQAAMQQQPANQYMNLYQNQTATPAQQAPASQTTGTGAGQAATSAAGNAAGGAASKLSGGMSKLTGVLKGVGKIIGGVGKIILTVVLSLIASLSAVKVLIDVATKAITNGIKPLNKAVRQITKALKPLLKTLSNIIKQIAEFVVKIVDSLMKVLDPILDMLEPVLNAIMDALNPLLDAVFQIVDLAMDILTPLMPLVDMILKNVTVVLDVVLGLVSDLLQPFIEIIQPIIEEFGEIFEPIMTGVSEILDPIREMFETSIKDIFAPQYALYKNVIGPAVEYITSLLKTYIGVVELGYGLVVSAVAPIVKGIGYITKYLVNKQLGDIVIKVGDVAGETGDLLMEHGKNNIDEGVTGAISAVTSFWKNMLNPTVDEKQDVIPKPETKDEDNTPKRGGSILDGIYGSGNPLNQHSYGSFMNMSDRGCGPVALADVVARRTGAGINPASLAMSMAGAGAYSTRSGTSIGGFLDTANAMGLGMQLGGVTSNSLRYASPSNPITVIGSGSAYGTRIGNNHYVNVLGTDGSGMAYVSNPLTGKVERRSASALAASSLAGIYGSGDIGFADVFGDAASEAFEEMKEMAGNLLGIFGAESGIGSSIEEIVNGSETNKAADRAASVLSETELDTYKKQAREAFEKDHPKNSWETDAAYEKRWQKYANKYLVQVSKEAVSKREIENAQSNSTMASGVQTAQGTQKSLAEQLTAAAAADSNAFGILGGVGSNLLTSLLGGSTNVGGYYDSNGNYVEGGSSYAGSSVLGGVLGSMLSGSTSTGGGTVSGGVAQIIPVVIKAYEAAGIIGKAGDYNQSGKTVTLNINGRQLKERPDCTGLVDSVIDAMGYNSEKKNSYAFNVAKGIKDASGQISPDWVLGSNPSISSLRQGDIVIIYGGGRHHGEIVSGVKGNTVYGWNYGYEGGMRKALKAANAQLQGTDPLTATVNAGSTLGGKYTRVIRYVGNGASAQLGATGGTAMGGSNNLLTVLLSMLGLGGTTNMMSTSSYMDTSYAGNNTYLATGSTDEKIWYYLINNLGFTKAGAAGVMGNFQAESGMLPNNLEDTYNKKLGMTDAQYTAAVDSGAYSKSRFISDHSKSNCGAGYGLPQFTWYTLKSKLYDIAKSKGVSIADIGAQMDTIAQSVDASLLNKLRTTNDIKTASDAWLFGYERPAERTNNSIKRAQNAQNWYNKFANWLPSGSDITTYVTSTPKTTSTTTSANNKAMQNTYNDNLKKYNGNTVAAASATASIAMTRPGSRKNNILKTTGNGDIDDMTYSTASASTGLGGGSNLLTLLLLGSLLGGSTGGLTNAASGVSSYATNAISSATQGMIQMTPLQQSIIGNTWDKWKNTAGLQQFLVAAQQSKLSPAQTAMVLATGVWEDGMRKLVGTKDVTLITHDINGQAAVGINNWVPKTNINGHDYSYGSTLAEQLTNIYNYYFSPNPTHTRARVTTNLNGYRNAFQQLTGYAPRLGVGDAYGTYANTDVLESMIHYTGNALIPLNWTSAQSLGKYSGLAAQIYNWMVQTGYVNGASQGVASTGGLDLSSLLGGYDTSSLLGGYDTSSLYGGYDLGTGFSDFGTSDYTFTDYNYDSYGYYDSGGWYDWSNGYSTGGNSPYHSKSNGGIAINEINAGDYGTFGNLYLWNDTNTGNVKALINDNEYLMARNAEEAMQFASSGAYKAVSSSNSSSNSSNSSNSSSSSSKPKTNAEKYERYATPSYGNLLQAIGTSNLSNMTQAQWSSLKQQMSQDQWNSLTAQMRNAQYASNSNHGNASSAQSTNALTRSAAALKQMQTNALYKAMSAGSDALRNGAKKNAEAQQKLMVNSDGSASDYAKFLSTHKEYLDFKYETNKSSKTSNVVDIYDFDSNSLQTYRSKQDFYNAEFKKFQQKNDDYLSDGKALYPNNESKAKDYAAKMIAKDYELSKKDKESAAARAMVTTTAMLVGSTIASSPITSLAAGYADMLIENSPIGMARRQKEARIVKQFNSALNRYDQNLSNKQNTIIDMMNYGLAGDYETLNVAYPAYTTDLTTGEIEQLQNAAAIGAGANNVENGFFDSPFWLTRAIGGALSLIPGAISSRIDAANQQRYQDAVQSMAMLGYTVDDRFVTAPYQEQQESTSITPYHYTPEYNYSFDVNDMWQAQANTAFIRNELSKYSNAGDSYSDYSDFYNQIFRTQATDYYTALDQANVKRSLKAAEERSAAEAAAQAGNQARNKQYSESTLHANESKAQAQAAVNNKAAQRKKVAQNNAKATQTAYSTAKSSGKSSAQASAIAASVAQAQAAANRKALKKKGKGDEGFSLSNLSSLDSLSSLTDYFSPITDYMTSDIFGTSPTSSMTINNASNMSIPDLDYSKFNTNYAGSMYADGMVVNQYYITPSNTSNEEMLHSILTNTYNVRAERVEELLEKIYDKMDDMEKEAKKRASVVTTSTSSTQQNLFPNNDIPAPVTRISQ